MANDDGETTPEQLLAWLNEGHHLIARVPKRSPSELDALQSALQTVTSEVTKLDVMNRA